MKEELPEGRQIRILDLGQAEYLSTWELQRSLRTSLLETEGSPQPGTLIICEHNPGVITLGRRAAGSSGQICQSLDRSIAVVETDRGGAATYHGPGQITCYPILNLSDWRKDVNWYLRSLETVIITALSSFGITGEAISEHTGVWVKSQRLTTDSAKTDMESQSDTLKQAPQGYAKIASLGVRLSKWISIHGFALNYGDCLAGFDSINACDYQSLPVTSMSEELVNSGTAPCYQELSSCIQSAFSQVFHCDVLDS